MKKIFFVVNNTNEFKSITYLKKYLPNINYIIETSFPIEPENFNLIILWNYKKIIPNISERKNVIIFHGFDLPLGKGWAPIYHTLSENLSDYTISGILPAEKVDSGDIIVKAKFSIKDNYTAEIIREFDNEISIFLIKKILERFPNNQLKGKKQVGTESYHERRYPEENEIKIDSKISENFNRIRACERTHPVFFYYNKIKYLIHVVPEKKPKFPDDLEIEFFDK